MLLLDIEGHAYNEKDISDHTFICHIFEINITITNSIAYCDINITKTNVSKLLQKLKLKKF